MSVFTVTLEAKRFRLLHELVPKTATIGVLLDSTFSSVDLQSSEVHNATRATGHHIRVVNVSRDGDIDEAFSHLVEIRADGLVVSGDPFLNSEREKLIALAARDTMPTIYEPRESTIAGGLMNYGPSVTDVYRSAWRLYGPKKKNMLHALHKGADHGLEGGREGGASQAAGSRINAQLAMRCYVKEPS